MENDSFRLVRDYIFLNFIAVPFYKIRGNDRYGEKKGEKILRIFHN